MKTEKRLRAGHIVVQQSFCSYCSSSSLLFNAQCNKIACIKIPDCLILFPFESYHQFKSLGIPHRSTTFTVQTARSVNHIGHLLGPSLFPPIWVAILFLIFADMASRRDNLRRVTRAKRSVRCIENSPASPPLTELPGNFGLPFSPEIRDMIYGYVLTPPNSYYQPLFVSRQTYTECHALFLRRNNVHFDSPFSLGRFLRRMGESRRQHIISVSFVCDLPICENPPRGLNLLAECPNLKTLKVTLPRATPIDRPDPRLKMQLQNIRGLTSMRFVCEGSWPIIYRPESLFSSSLWKADWGLLRKMMMEPRSDDSIASVS